MTVLFEPTIDATDTLASPVRATVTLVNDTADPVTFSKLFVDGNMFIRLSRTDPLGFVAEALGALRDTMEPMAEPAAYTPTTLSPGQRLSIPLDDLVTWSWFLRRVGPDDDRDDGGAWLVRAGVVGSDSTGQEIGAVSELLTLRFASTVHVASEPPASVKEPR